MPNTNLFPSDFIATAISASNTGGTVTVESSIRGILVDSLLTALRTQQSSRGWGQQIAALQNTTTQGTAKSTRMPLFYVGKTALPQLALGTVGYGVAGQDTMQANSMERMLFSNESLTLITVRLTTQRHFPAIAASQKAFYTAGGWEDAPPGRLTSTVNKTAFLDESTTRMATTLSTPTYGFTACGNLYSGYWFGGVASWATTFKKIEKMLYATEVMSLLSAVLGTGRFAGIGTAGTSTYAYLFGSSSATFGTWSALTSIEKFAYNGETPITVSSNLARAQGHHTTAGNAIAAYICGGWTSASAPYISSNPSVYAGNTYISRFTFSSEANTGLGITLTTSRHVCASYNSNRSMYVVGGWYQTSVWPIACTDIDKLDISSFGSETILRLGVNLITNRSEFYGISDYAAGFYS